MIKENLAQVLNTIPEHTTLVAVSKTKPNEAIMEAYNEGYRVFGENKVQELVEKQETLPKDIEWHLIGSLQRNKVKYIAPFVHLIHAIDSLKLLREVNKRAAQNERVISCLIQVKISPEETKHGFDINAIDEILEEAKSLDHIRIEGLMGMASNTKDTTVIEKEFKALKATFDEHPSLTILSMGMSGDYTLAIDCGSTMVRVGSSIFGARSYT